MPDHAHDLPASRPRHPRAGQRRPGRVKIGSPWPRVQADCHRIPSAGRGHLPRPKHRHQPATHAVV